MEYFIDNNGELYHAKYLSKKWVNGKWNYVYKKDAAKKTPTTSAAKSATTRSSTTAPTNAKTGKTSDKYGKASNWQYIKREWKNGKWNYTYAGESASNNSAKNKKVSKEYQEENEYNSRRNAYPTLKLNNKNNTSSKNGDAKNPNGSKEYQEENEYNNRRKGYQTPKDSTENNKSSKNTDAKNPNGSKEYQEEREYNNQRNTYPIPKAKTNVLDSMSKLIENAKTQGIDVVNKVIDSLSKNATWPAAFDKKTGDTTPDEDMAMVNPNYKRLFKKNNYDENCAACTIAYDLRRRGYDVEVKSDDSTLEDGYYGLTADEILKVYSLSRSDLKTTCNGVTRDTQQMQKNLTKLEDELLTYGDGARGNFMVYWSQGGGHSVSWEVENGEVVIRDAQTNKKHKLDDYANSVAYFEYIRTDNAEVSDEVLKYVKKREEGRKR